jgi:Ca2+-binding RTX toxin-like protein
LADTREFLYWSIDLSGDGSSDGNGLNAPVTGEFPLEPGEIASVFTRALVYQGSDGAGGGIFLDETDGSQIYVSDTVRLDEGASLPDPVDGDLPLNGEDGGSPLPDIAFTDGLVSWSEGDEGTTELVFLLERSGDDVSGASTVDVAFVPIITDAEDFGGTLPTTQTVEFASGETQNSVTIEVSGDIDPEPDETFGLVLESPTNAVIDDSDGGGSAFGIIVNDDGPPIDSGDFNVINGTPGKDYLPGTKDNDLIRGFEQADLIEGDNGDDILDGDAGDDILFGNDDNDILIGDLGTDILDGGSGDDILLGGADGDVIRGGSGKAYPVVPGGRALSALAGSAPS